VNQNVCGNRVGLVRNPQRARTVYGRHFHKIRSNRLRAAAVARITYGQIGRHVRSKQKDELFNIEKTKNSRSRM
jgi:hypothetical protein